ncbi:MULTISPECIES: aromatic amino acid transaminase [unclassified Ensifer]|uniref:aromatic amino acid transaminase n=1 Tax=unclassified Ensifer TaxID=2633371 RepID=UPI000813BAF4|nr:MULTISPECIES: aromatic amino acid transaminase [unclassified Ensifer]OCP05769.1 aspartate aminotransferase [Ensifer sp. LC11]OCP06514.1 aspartate aminotransferase [Ensifer sp. LC13]OCP06760.1 aspartate aminotransferase [Ensifer sp. LC14]OCP31247.1 aspartate aminotransferase [Ensifer sp. LC499]
MLAALPTAEPDPLWALLSTFRQDRRADKIDLVVGVYRDASGQTPVMRAVQDAEAQLASAAASKSYRALSGNTAFNEGMSRLLLGEGAEALDRQCTIQTVGGTGALRILADFIALVSPRATIWNTNPGYVNHRPIMLAAGLAVRPFRWQESETGLDIEAAIADLQDARPGDVIILHGCCHNPTGTDPSAEEWRRLAALCKDRGLIPLIDMAYQGFGDGIEEDAWGLRHFAKELDTVLVAASCSKNMGLYCERTGAAMVIAADNRPLANVRATLERITRANYSMPPEHGAAIAAQLFEDPQTWLAELEASRERVAGIRRDLADALARCGAPEKFQALRRQKGMFSLLPLDLSQMNRLREEFGVYGTANGRINIAGLLPGEVERLARTLRAVSSVSSLVHPIKANA